MGDECIGLGLAHAAHGVLELDVPLEAVVDIELVVGLAQAARGQAVAVALQEEELLVLVVFYATENVKFLLHRLLPSQT